jgi:transposase
MKKVKYVGLDVHKNAIAIAIADEGRDGEVRSYGTIANTAASIDKFLRKIVSDGSEPDFVYEAGPCGYTLYRYLTGKGYRCMVAAPSLIPKRSGDRIKTDRRDAVDLARLHRAGELTAVYVPNLEDEAMRGVSLIVAATTLAELGDLSRFDHPSKLMAHLGLIPSEHSSGETKKRGGNTKTGNGHVRRVLVEAAHAYRLPARVSRILLKRQEGMDAKIKEIAWNVQVRLCARYRRLGAKGKAYNVVIIAIARELAAFIWAIARCTSPFKFAKISLDIGSTSNGKIIQGG